MSSASTRAGTDDASLVAASRAGGIDAFGRLVERYQNLVCAVAYSNTGDRLLSEDIGQETFLTAWDKLDTVKEPEKLRSWLCSIARNLSSKAVRVRKREQLSDAEALDRNAGADPSPLVVAITNETETTVWQALEELPENYREPRSSLETDGASLWIATVETGSPAAKSGLRAGDSVLEVGQMQIGDDLPPSEAMISLSRRWRSKGRAVNWVVERGGRELTLPVVVPE